MESYRIGVLGATGAVGQQLVSMLAGHPWFTLTEVVASDRSAGRSYGEAVRWRLDSPVPAGAGALTVKDLKSELQCDLLISALDADLAGPTEVEFAMAGYPVVSNSSSHRMDDDVPLLIPEVNPEHLAVIDVQRRRRGYAHGFIVTNPNCSTIGLTMALKPLHDAFGLAEVQVVTMQAISGAGLDGVPAGAIQDNVIPYIKGEEEKLESEPQKILGGIGNDRFLPAEISISAHCNRVAVLDGHTEAVSVRLRQRPSLEEVRAAIHDFHGIPQEMGLPTGSAAPLLLAEAPDRPQPRLDRNAGEGMTVVVGRLRPCPVLDWKFTVLSHNMVRGAAGAALLNAELLVARGYVSGAA